MDLWKLLLLAVVVVGLVLILSQPPEPPRLPAGARVEEGTFKVSAGGGTWEELFGVYPVDAGFRVVSILHQKGRVFLEADLLYDPRWQPLGGTLTRRLPEEVRTVFVCAGTEILVRVQRGARETSETVSVPEGTLVWEPEILGSLYALLRAAPRAGTLTVFALQAQETHALAIDAGEDVYLRALGRLVPATLRRLARGDRVFHVYQQGDLLLGMWTEAFSAHLVEVLPEGLQR